MKAKFFMMLVCILVLPSLTAFGQMIKRTDAVWARTTTSPIVLDGQLNEAAWATAESIKVEFAKDSGIPGSGWFRENGENSPTNDPTNATIKFLVRGDSLFVGIVCLDKSVGGGLFNQFDGFLMNVRRKELAAPSPPFEYFYGWVTEPWADPNTGIKGASPGFFGFAGGTRHPGAGASHQDSVTADSLGNIWNAVTTVQGISNSDTAADVSWTTELKFNLKERGYNVSQPSGDIVMWSGSIYDADYQWPLDTVKQSGNRVWLQCPWGNAMVYDHVRVYAMPSVGTTGTVPAINADYVISSGNNFPTPVFDGKLDDAVWAHAPSIPLQYGNTTIRNAYAGTGPSRSGQFQPDVNGGAALVSDASLATVKYFYKADTLYLGFSTNDAFVQSVPNFLDRWDGFRVTLNARNERNGDSVLLTRRLTFIVSDSGTALRQEDLANWDSSATAVKVKLALNAGTTVDTTGTTFDNGYTAEMKIYLPAFGYPVDRGDGVTFLGIVYFDGDSFTPASDSYGTRSWFMRENDNGDGPAWFWMNPAAVLTSVSTTSGLPTEFALLGNYPNPFNPSTTIRFEMGRVSEVTLQVYDILGRQVASQTLGVREAGQQSVSFNAANLASGTYYYRLKMASTGASLIGKMMLLK